MKIISKPVRIFLLLINVLMVAVSGMVFVIGDFMAKTQTYNYAAQRWSQDTDYAQVSCFLKEDSGFTKDNIDTLKFELVTALKEAGADAEGQGSKPYPEAYSISAGVQTLKSNRNVKSDTDVTVVGGDFFTFHAFELLDGSYLYDDDTMQDGILIDHDLAWTLYGTVEVSGLAVYIGDAKFYISGVVETPSTKVEKQCSGSLPKAYITYEGAERIGLSSSGEDNAMNTDSANKTSYVEKKFNKINCYECMLPCPVEKFAYEKVKKFFEENYKNKYEIVDNTGRFEPSLMYNNHKKLYKYFIDDSSISYPYWENASRIMEYKLSNLYFWQRMLLVCPFIAAVCMFVKVYRAGGVLKARLKAKASDKYDRFRTRKYKRENYGEN
ncbi:MAG TPA: hypothetical protein DCG30_01065 [Ruminococcus sp.]|nr:hypothetical protein [Ruminococcus sp.]